MPTYATPGVYFERVDQADQAVPAMRTDIAAFVGIAQQGPVGVATAVESWQQFQSTFGSFIPDGYLAYSARAFFENGGEKMYVVRVAAPESSTATNPAAAQPADGSASIVLSVTGFAAGAVATLQQTTVQNAVGAQPADRMSSIVASVAGFPAGSLVQILQPAPPMSAWHTVQSVDAASNRLYWDKPLEPGFLLAPPITFTAFHQEDRLISSVNIGTNTIAWAQNLGPAFDLTQSITIKSGAASSRGVLYDSSSTPTLQLKASNPGSWGDRLAVSVAYSSLASTASSAQTQPASGAYTYVNSVVGFLPYSVVRIFQSSVPLGYRTLVKTDPLTNTLWWDSPVVPAFDVTKAMSFETVEFSLTVYASGSSKEIFSGLSLNPNHPRYAPLVVNPPVTPAAQNSQSGLTSQYIRVKDLQSTTPIPNNLPNPGAPQLTDGALYLGGGRDGIAALRVLDFTGDSGSSEKWGIRAMEDVDEISIVAVPDILIEPAVANSYAPPPVTTPNPCLPRTTAPAIAPPPAPPPAEIAPSFPLDDVYQVQQALVQHCQTMQFRFAILDPPDFGYPKLHVDLGEVQSWRQRFDTMYAALYYPWILVRDPLQLGNSVVRRVPPSGHVAGVYANTDLSVGVFKAPANLVLQWAQDLTTEVTPEAQAFLNPIDVDCIRTFSGRGMRVYGARTLSSDSSWRFVNVRRLFFMVEHALLISLQWVVFEPNDIHLWNQVRSSITNFLETLWNEGAFAGNTAEESFYVKCDSTNNTSTTTALGQLFIEIGIAPALPAEFVVFRIGRVGDTLEVTE
jgi:phage tail sheath protein FI